VSTSSSTEWCLLCALGASLPEITPVLSFSVRNENRVTGWAVYFVKTHALDLRRRNLGLHWVQTINKEARAFRRLTFFREGIRQFSHHSYLLIVFGVSI